MARALILTGGISHDFDAASRALVEVLKSAGIDADVTEDISGGVAQLRAGGFDLLVVLALRWSMSGERFDDKRDLWGYSLTESERDVIAGFVAEGGGMLAMHTAVICFDDWPEWKTMIGGVWRWDQSYHPPYGKVFVEPTGAKHPVTEGIGPFELDDEVYSGLDLEPDVEPLLMLRADGENEPMPGLWVRDYGKGRVAFDGLGHDADAIRNPSHAGLIRRAAVWALGETEDNVRQVQ
ncbi:MAG: ThuA domain-containing protein [Pseudomonadota bacterium]|nr:ThuA domain-containing protein [Pseudomonadota bacterium]